MKYLSPFRKNDMLSELTENFDRLLSSFNNFPEFQSSQLASLNWSPRIDVKEQPNQYTINVDVPGIDPSNIDLSVDNGVLTIKGEKESEKKEEKENYLRIERSSGSFMRQMTLPEAIDANKVKAKGKHGVLEITLEITLPKLQKSASQKIQIESEK